jgi:hypothetical protein
MTIGGATLQDESIGLHLRNCTIDSFAAGGLVGWFIRGFVMRQESDHGIAQSNSDDFAGLDQLQIVAESCLEFSHANLDHNVVTLMQYDYNVNAEAVASYRLSVTAMA